MKIFPEPPGMPQGFGVRQPPGAFRRAQSGRELPQSMTLARQSESCDRP
jgi:hypothetical protein